MFIKDKINWLLKYCSEYPEHEFMYDERVENSNTFNVDLGIENYILENIDNVHLVLLTGDAGDGKSRILYNLKSSLDSWEYIYDFSELNEYQQKKCVEDIYNAVESKEKKYIVAGNSGIFIHAVVEYEYRLLDKLTSRENCLVLNFKNRNLAEKTELFSKIVRKFLSHEFEKCINCAYCENCPFSYNLVMMQAEETLEGIRTLFDSIFLMGLHITFRDLLSSLAYFVTRGIDCKELHLQLDNDENSIEDYYFYNNVFSHNGDNKILLAFAEIDVAKKDIYDFDYSYYHKLRDIDYLARLKMLNIKKRELFFKSPTELSNGSHYTLLPEEFLSEYRLLIKQIKEMRYINSLNGCDEVELLRKFELGLNKISNPNHTNAQLVLFDSPPITSKDVMIEYVSGEELSLIFCTPSFFITNNNEQNNNLEFEDIDVFYCFVYDENKIFQECPSIKINYSLFKQVMLAENDIFTEKSARLPDNAHIQSFTKAIFDNANEINKINVRWLKDKNNNSLDFGISFLKPSVLDRVKLNKIQISTISG